MNSHFKLIIPLCIVITTLLGLYFNLFPVIISPNTRGVNDDIIYLFDLKYTNQLDAHDAYEHTHLVASIAGLANRDGPKFYYYYNDIDSYWFDYLRDETDFLKGKTF